jgi:4-amino-4-deoxy-L-arabinose transferase-like glycosyltransferase
VKRRKTSHHVQSAAPPESPGFLNRGWRVEIIAVLILAGIPFAMGKFFEFNQPDPFDGGAYAYSAWHVLQGAKLFEEEIISAQPATFLMNYIGVAMCGFSETGPKIIQTILQLAALGFMFYTLRKCFGKTAAVISTAAAAIYLSAPVIAKFGNVKEQFMIAFMIIAACCLMLAVKTQKNGFWAAAGAAVVWPYYFKPTGLSVLIAMGLFIPLLAIMQRWGWKLFLNRLFLLAIGAVAGISPLMLFFQLKTGDPSVIDMPPMMLVKLIFVLVAVGYVEIAIVWASQRCHLLSRLKTVPSIYWKAGGIAVVLAYVIGIISVRIQPGAMREDIGSYLYATIFFDLPRQVYWGIDGFAHQFWTAMGTDDAYITGSRALMGFSRQAPIVLRYYGVLCLPITLAIVSILVVLFRAVFQTVKKIYTLESQDWMAMFLAAWWLLDIAMTWVSPRSYEQYYLPMCASSAMLGGYAVWRLMTRFNPAQTHLGKAICAIAIVAVVAMVFPIFAGITHSPFSGQAYGQRSRGYLQSWTSTWNRLRGQDTWAWEQLGDYIRTHSTPQDRIYVWGWYPGIYVRAQRISASPQAFEGNMHILSPSGLAGQLNVVLNGFAKHPPKFIVDSRKREFPWNVPPMELWPYVPKEWKWRMQGFLPADPQVVEQYEKDYAAFLTKQVSPEEAGRFMAMKPFRDYVMKNYDIAQTFGTHILFVRKASVTGQ